MHSNHPVQLVGSRSLCDVELNVRRVNGGSWEKTLIMNLLNNPRFISSSSWRLKLSMALLHSTSMGFPTLLDVSASFVLSSLSCNMVDKLRTIFSRSSSGVVPFVSGSQIITKIIVIKRTIANGANEYAPRLFCKYGKRRPTMKLHAQLTWHDADIAVATYFASNISATMSHGIGPNPISKKLTNVTTKKREAILSKYPRRQTTSPMQDTSIPPADQRMSVLLLLLSIRNKATYVAATLTPPTIAVPIRGFSINPSKNIVE
mmetsp:Transcript_5353/g.11167  ORF Transcript_5353/g.11167 Transcript_5353/m.11167 type:complete len:261 (+) Transcript_5353:963-1745(+)